MRIARWFNSWATMELRDIHVHGINEIVGTYRDCYGDKYYAAVPHIMFFSKRVKAF
jgi:hypothetical protein